MIGAIPPFPQYAFIASCSVKKKHRDNFTLPFIIIIIIIIIIIVVIISMIKV